jgi:hypothetical protein
LLAPGFAQLLNYPNGAACIKSALFWGAVYRFACCPCRQAFGRTIPRSGSPIAADGLKLRTTPVVYDNGVSAHFPILAFGTLDKSYLPDQPYASPGVYRTLLYSIPLRLTGHPGRQKIGLVGAGSSRSREIGLETGAATVIHPNRIPVYPPIHSFRALRVAELSDEPHIPACVDRAFFRHVL